MIFEYMYIYIHLCAFLYFILRQPLPKDDTERINYVLQLYDKILDFLLSHGAHLIHVSAQFLLNYDDYLISIDIARRNVSYELLFYLCFSFSTF